ncbi:MAG: hypothetical protein JJE07_07165 [Flavobacteriaceae bacterium]|jgi:hypothetical protein|nr:hypothetical protein [Flavobacteriaceae bacterium]
MKKLRDQIFAELKKVTPKTAGNVFNAIQYERGYKMVEELIIEMMVDEQMSISGCIPNVNREI